MAKNSADAERFLPKGGGGGVAVSVKSNKLVSILKLLIFLSILPVAAGVSYGFLNTFSVFDKQITDVFWAGVAAFFLVDLVILRLASLYKKGQRIIEIIFHFVAPLVKFAPYVLPIYTILILVFAVTFSFFKDISPYRDTLLFLTGFSIILHFVYTADAMRAKQSDFLKASYFFSIVLVFLFNVIILAATLNRFLPEFSFMQFFQNACTSTKDAYKVIFDQFFAVKNS
ncbi:MAG: hypothetical protein Q8L26_02220 [Candidatus Omnitrophota bacterium]|nr:hypothetical protein [Candidatus Omnitrophota bacterium]